MPRFLLGALAVFALVVNTVAAQSFETIWTASYAQGLFPFRPVDVDGVGDLDGDGQPDLVVAIDNPLPDSPGRVEILSGATGAFIRELAPPPLAGSRFALSLVTLDDLNGDGHPEVAVGDATALSTAPAVQLLAHIYDPVTGVLLQTHSGPSGFLARPILRRLSDADGDGIRSLAIAGIFEGTLAAGLFGGEGVTIVDPAGATAPVFLPDLNPPTPAGVIPRVTTSLVAVDDRDGDGVEDLLYASTRSDFGLVVASRFDLLAGAGLGVIGPALGPGAAPSIPPQYMRLVSDQDGDGRDEVVISDLTGGRYAVHAIGQAAPLFGRQVPPLMSAPFEARGLGDCDGDGVADVALSHGDTSEPVLVTVRQPRGIATEVSPTSIGSAVRFVAAYVDLNGDGLDEGIMSIGNELRLVSFAGTRVFGGPQDIDLAWRPYGVAGATIGAIEATGAPANAAGLLWVSRAPFNGLIAGAPALVDPTPGVRVLSEAVTFDAQGAFGIGLNLAQTALVDIPLYFQFLALEAPGTVRVSNGLAVKFIPGVIKAEEVWPRSVVGGETVTLTGSGFEPGVVVELDGVAQPTTFVDARTLTFVVLGNPVYDSSLVVRNATGECAASVNFNVTPLVGSSSSISVDAVSGALTVVGGPFTPGTTLILNGQTLTPTFLTPDTVLSFTAPPQPTGSVATATLQVPGGPTGAGTTFTLTLNFQ